MKMFPWNDNYTTDLTHMKQQKTKASILITGNLPEPLPIIRYHFKLPFIWTSNVTFSSNCSLESIMTAHNLLTLGLCEIHLN